MKVGLYCRVSTQEQAVNGHSIDEQKNRMKKYCDAMNWEVFNIYTDAGFSGASTDRPALQKLIKEIKRMDKVLVYKLDRLSRSQKDTLMLIEDVFLKNGVDFVSMTENFDTSTPFGKAMIGILAVFAQLEREQIKERMIMGHVARAKRGKFHGSDKIPIGYDYVNGELITNEYEKLQVQKVFELCAQGFSLSAIAEKMDGFTHKGKPWTTGTVREVLKKKTYLGYINYKGKWYQGTHEPFISEKLYETVQTIREKKKNDYHVYNRRAGKVNSYLGGLLICGQCHAKCGKISHRSNGQEYCYYICNSRSKKNPSLVKNVDCKNKIWKMNELDNIVFTEIKKLSLMPKFESQIENSDTENIVILDELKKIESQTEKLLDLFSVNEIPQDILQKRIHDLTSRKEKLESKITETKSPELTINAIKTFGDILENGNFEEIRSLIEILIEYIELDGDDVIIHWNF